MPIYKHGKIAEVGNYRPISIISTVAKIYGRIVHDQFYSYLLKISTVIGVPVRVSLTKKMTKTGKVMGTVFINTRERTRIA